MRRRFGHLSNNLPTNCDNNLDIISSMANRIACLLVSLIILTQVTPRQQINATNERPTLLQQTPKPNETLTSSDLTNNLLFTNISNNNNNNVEVDVVLPADYSSSYFSPYVEDLHAVESEQSVSNRSGRDFFASPPYSTVISLLPPSLISYVPPSANPANTTILSFGPNSTSLWQDHSNGNRSKLSQSTVKNNYNHKPSTSGETILFDVTTTGTIGGDNNQSVVNGGAYINNSSSRSTQSSSKSFKTTVVNNQQQDHRNKYKQQQQQQQWERDKEREMLENVVRQAHENLLESVMVTNKTRTFLSCEQGDMLIKINFTEPFRGIAYANSDRLTPCRLFGDGSQYYELSVPLRGCGTRQEAPRLFLNNIHIRFHRALELEEDEVKTIICRYPPPMAPPPAQIPQGPPERIIEGPPEPAKLIYFDPLLIISGLLFLALLLLGLGFGTLAIKRQATRNIHSVSDEFKIPIPPSIVAQTVYDSFVDTTSIVETISRDTLEKDRVVVDLHGGMIDRPAKLESKIIDETNITNTHHQQVEEKINKIERSVAPKYIIKNIEDTYITKIDEIDESELDMDDEEAPPLPNYTTIKKRPAGYNTFTKTINNKASTIKTTDNLASTTGDKKQTQQQAKDDVIDDTRSIDSQQTTINEGPFVSMCPTLTSPEQFKRLQTIVDIFDETIIEHHQILTSGDSEVELQDDQQREIIVYESRPRLSKYRSNINELDVGQRLTLHKLLTLDENFRSLIVECTTQEKIRRKLRQNPLYSRKLNRKTWNLLTRVLIETASPNDFTLTYVGVMDERENSTNHYFRDSTLISDAETVISAKVSNNNNNNLLSLNNNINEAENLSRASIPDYYYEHDSLNGVTIDQLTFIPSEEIHQRHLMLIPRPETSTSAFISRHQHHLTLGHNNYDNDLVVRASSKVVTTTSISDNKLEDIISDDNGDNNQDNVIVYGRSLTSPRPQHKKHKKMRTKTRNKN